MNKLTKVGVSALCGSLAAVSAANAGSMTVAGGANVTYTQLSYGETGNPMGMASNLTFTGTGELDNGNTVTLNIAHDDANAYSASDVAVDIAGVGTIKFDQGGGTGLDRIDDMMPTAWEEADGTGVGGGLNTVSGVGGGTDIEWAISGDMLPDGMSAYVAYSPKPVGDKGNDKTVSGATGAPVDGAGFDIVLMHDGLVDGLNVFGGYSNISQATDAGSATIAGDKTQTALGATYAIGSITVGYQYSKDSRNGTNATTSFYENNAYGISFNVNDDLSISYGVHESERHVHGAANATMEAASLQMAYSMGGATIKIAETSVDSSSYVSTTAGDKDGTTVMLSLAF
jgi:outer membrane protein OmpU